MPLTPACEAPIVLPEPCDLTARYLRGAEEASLSGSLASPPAPLSRHPKLYEDRLAGRTPILPALPSIRGNPMQTTRVLSALVSALFVLGLAACTSTLSSGPKPPEVDVTGTWQGRWFGSVASGSISLKLKQDGARVTGQMALTGGPPELLSAPVMGDVSGKSFSFSSTGPFRADLSVTGEQMGGPFVYRQSNTMSLSRVN